ncbi:hypothetical protein [Desulfosporosinus nitroreducens]|uniref:Uncharacterized protein n=1 Tax=Desulfosporosinus nitroreducens TaxID=2018668 RepID=A0ABT8QS33_9FIRM|nr:hypothetical protein [Desulfosporosinus nitroreducens]MCO1602509.1 hypothetical protein [Desulfosporosinus nitroreducens]MDO0824158.1 hypothetical protein [Desulfosporosinus nitroreducens]
MKKCDEYIQRFTLTGQDSGIKKLSETEVEEYKLIYDTLITKLIDTGGEVPGSSDIQVINKLYTCNDECVTPLGLVNVSLEYLAKLLTFCKKEGIHWLVDIKECTDTHFRELSYFKIIVDCSKDKFMTIAKEGGFRYKAIK